jgi:hypothetical protein
MSGAAAAGVSTTSVTRVVKAATGLAIGLAIGLMGHPV